MVAQHEIVGCLKRLEKTFEATKSPIDQRYLSKVALIELCGWIEEELDKLMLKFGERCLKGTEYETKYEKIVTDVFGFNYDKHFRRMLVQLLGMHGANLVEKKVGLKTYSQLKSTLGTLKKNRDSLAHTQLRGRTPHLMGFSVLQNNQQIIFLALKDYDRALNDYLN